MSKQIPLFMTLQTTDTRKEIVLNVEDIWYNTNQTEASWYNSFTYFSIQELRVRIPAPH